MDLIHSQERDRLLAFLRRLVRRAQVGGRALPGLAHSEASGAPLVFLDNAVAAEALAIPALHDADPALHEAALNLVLAAPPGARGAVPETASGRVEVVRDDPRNPLVLTPWHRLTGDLTAGVLRQSLRGEDEGQEVRHTGNLVRLSPAGLGPASWLARLGLRPRTLDVEEAVTGAGVEREGEGVLLFHESALRVRPVPWLGATVAAGTIRYEYRSGPADPMLRLSVTLRAAPGLALRDIRVSTALDDLSLVAPPVRGAAVGRSGAAPAGREGSWEGLSTLAEGTLDTLHLWTPGAEAEGGSLGLHIRPRMPAAVHSARAQARDGHLHWVVIRHAVPPLPAGGTATVREDRLLSRGPWPRALDAAMKPGHADGEASARDPGILLGTGPALAAVGGALLYAPSWNAPPPPGHPTRWRAWLERGLDALPDDATPADLALAAVATDGLHRAGGRPEDLARLDRLMDRILALPPRTDPLAAGAVLLALARAALSRPAPRVSDALLAALVEVPDAGWDDASSPALAMLLRGLRAVAFSPLPPEQAARVEALCAALLDTLSARLRPHGGWLEVAATSTAQAGDALSQAAALLAVLSPDAAALPAGPPAT